MTRTMTFNAAAGPVTCKEDPPKIAAKPPPIAPARSPALAGNPQATAKAIFNGKATDATVIADNVSCNIFLLFITPNQFSFNSVANPLN